MCVEPCQVALANLVNLAASLLWRRPAAAGGAAEATIPYNLLGINAYVVRMPLCLEARILTGCPQIPLRAASCLAKLAAVARAVLQWQQCCTHVRPARPRRRNFLLS